MGPAPAAGSVIKVYQIDLNDPTVTVNTLSTFLAFDPGYRGGVRVAAGNVAGPDSRQEIIVGADTTGGPRVRVLNLFGSEVSTAFSPIGDFFAMDPAFRGGVRVAAGELDGNPLDGDELVVAAGTTGGPRVQVFRSDGVVLADFFAFRSDFRGGVQVSFENTGIFGRLQIDAGDLDPSQRNDALNAAAIGGFQTTDPTAIVVDNVPVVNNVGGLGFATTNTGTFGTGFGTPALGGFSTPGFGATGIGGFDTPGFTTGGTASLGGFGTPGTGGFSSPGFSGSTGTFGTELGTSGQFASNATGVTGTVPSIGFTLFGDPGPLNPFPAFFAIPFTGVTIGSVTFGTGTTTVFYTQGSRATTNGT